MIEFYFDDHSVRAAIIKVDALLRSSTKLVLQAGRRRRPAVDDSRRFFLAGFKAGE